MRDLWGFILCTFGLHDWAVSRLRNNLVHRECARCGTIRYTVEAL